MTDLPSGTLAFLFTDIEGSTRRWERAPKAMAAAVAHHDVLLNAIIVGNGGAVFKTVGDAFCAAFATVPSAVAAALAIQHAVAKEAWSEIDDLCVRIAIHVGEADERDADYFGPAVNRVARLLSVGYGGQILLSLPAAELARDSLISNTQLRDLGQHRLKDLSRPEHIFQLIAEGLPSDFPPLKTLDRRSHNLPEQATPLIGREDALNTARGILEREDVRLLTLSGPGGVGKTRLGLQVAAELVDTFSDGVWFVPLAPLRHADLVISAIAQTLSVGQLSDQSLTKSLIDALEDKHLLIFLDNFEHVTASSSSLGQLIAACPKLKVLVTSRAVLHLYGEQELSVQPLVLPDLKRMPVVDDLASIESVRLFVERAQAVKTGFAVTEANAASIAAICVRLDGLPLAIELAAARVRMLPPGALLARLDNQLKLLTGGGVDRDPRQQTLRGTIAWSHDLLDSSEKGLFRRLAVFAGGFSIEAGEAVANGGEDLILDVFDGMASLVEKSLLRQESDGEREPRFVMFESVREFGIESLINSGEAEQVRQHHAEYYLSFAEQAEPHLSGPEQIFWLDQLEQEQGNLDAALRWLHDQRQTRLALRLAGALGPFWSLRGHFSQGRSHLDALLAMAGMEHSQQERTKALNAAGVLAESQGDFHRASELYEESLAIARQLGDARVVAQALNNLGSVAISWSDLDRAQVTLEEALDAAREVGDKYEMATSLVDLGRVAHMRSDFEAATDLYQKGLIIFREIGNHSQISKTLNNLGSVAQEQGRNDRAETLLKESLTLHRAVGDTRSVAGTLVNLGEVARVQGNDEYAAELYGQSKAMAEEIGDKLGMAIAIENHARLLRDHDDYCQAGLFYKQAFTFYRGIFDWIGVIDCLNGLASMAMVSGPPESAVRLFGAAAALRDAHALPSRAGDDPMCSALENAREILGQDTFPTICEQGRTMSLEEAWEEAQTLHFSAH